MIIERETSHAALHAAGATTVRQLAPNKFEVSPDINEADLPPLELQAAKSRKLEEIKQFAEASVAAIRNQYPDFERETWPSQEREARAWTADNNAPAPTLSGIEQTRGKSVAYLAPKVIEKADQYRTLASNVSGKRQGLADAIDAIKLANYATVQEAVAAVDAINW